MSILMMITMVYDMNGEERVVSITEAAENDLCRLKIF